MTKKKTKKEKKMSQPGRRMYSMYARSDRYILRPQVRISSQSSQSSKSLRNLNQVQRNFQFSSRAKTSKEGNNGLDKKDWTLKKSLDSFYIG